MAILEAPRKLVSSFDPDTEQQRPVRRHHPLSPDRVERGAIGIYGEVTGNRDFETAERKWNELARQRTKDQHRREAEACLRAAG